MDWNPTPEMVKTAEAAFLATAIHEKRTEQVLAIQRQVLAEMQSGARPEFIEACVKGIPEGPILDPRYAWLLSEADFSRYVTTSEERQRQTGLYPQKPGNCPMLEAELVRKAAEDQVIDAVGATLPRPLRSEGLHGDLRKQALELCLRLLAPFVRSADKIIGERVNPQLPG